MGYAVGFARSARSAGRLVHRAALVVSSPARPSRARGSPRGLLVSFGSSSLSLFASRWPRAAPLPFGSPSALAIAQRFPRLVSSLFARRAARLRASLRASGLASARFGSLFARLLSRGFAPPLPPHSSGAALPAPCGRCPCAAFLAPRSLLCAPRSRPWALEVPRRRPPAASSAPCVARLIIAARPAVKMRHRSSAVVWALALVAPPALPV